MKKTIISFFFNALLLTSLSAAEFGVVHPSTDWGKIRLTSMVNEKLQQLDYEISNEGGEISLHTNDGCDMAFQGKILNLLPTDNPIFYSLFPRYMNINNHGPIHITQPLHLEAEYNISEALKALNFAGLIDKESCIFILTHPFNTKIRDLTNKRTFELMELRLQTTLTAEQKKYSNCLSTETANKIASLSQAIEEIQDDVNAW